jgi:catechol 2,3-dioxygenase-like lactoylglutathione lyase family enzyme
MNVERVIPILRIFDVAKAKEFYVDYLGFTVDWEHRYEPDLPLYMQVSRDGLTLHLSEHYGDGTPGSTVYVEMTGIEAFHAEIAAKKYRYLRPGLDEGHGKNGKSLALTDPFGNRLRLNQRDG